MFKKVLICTLICLLMFPIGQAAAQEFDRDAAADEIWECLIDQIENKKVAAAIMAYFKRESGYRSDSIAGWHLTKRPVCEEFTESLYDLTEEEFILAVQFKGGYGLGGWYSSHYAKQFYQFFNEHEYAYDDIQGQCEFVIWSIQQYDELWQELEDAYDAEAAGRLMGYKYDGACEISYNVIGSYAKQIYAERIQK